MTETLDQFWEEIQNLEFPFKEKKILLHTCCAPCSTEAMMALKKAGVETTIIFYNPNIHPKEEYEHRKNENIRFAKKLGMPFVDLDYDPDNFHKKVKGYEDEAEKGRRCDLCFDMRFEKSAKYAHENGFKIFSSTLGLSRHKDFEQVSRWGKKAASKYPGLMYWDYNFRKQGGEERRNKIAKIEGMYHQNYCGCIYSLINMQKTKKAS